ncbi:MAG: hypothetical protein ACLRRT_10305 [Ruthenibacterium lactatiformans]
MGEAETNLIWAAAARAKARWRAVGGITGLPVVHLDGLCWQPGWVAMERAAWRHTVENEIAKDAWIIDGNFKLAGTATLPRAGRG